MEESTPSKSSIYRPGFPKSNVLRVYMLKMELKYFENRLFSMPSLLFFRVIHEIIKVGTEYLGILIYKIVPCNSCPFLVSDIWLSLT